MARTLTQIVMTVAGLPRPGFALRAETGLSTYYDARGELLVGIDTLATRTLVVLGACETAREFEALTGFAPSVWETTCDWCGRLTLVAAGETEELCPRCLWANVS